MSPRRKLSPEERQHKQLLNEADRDYPRSLALLKAVLEKVGATRKLRTAAARDMACSQIRADIGELVCIVAEEQDAVTARQFRERIAAIGRTAEKVAFSLADAIGSQALKDLGKKAEKCG